MKGPAGRRAFLKAAGALAIPGWVRRALAAPADLPPRLVIMMQANGTHQPGFWPSGTPARSPILAPLLSDPRLATVTTLVKGLRIETGGVGNEHDRGFCGLWTGMPTVGLPSEAWAGGPSIDQMCRRDHRIGPRLVGVPYPTLNTAVHASYVPPKNPHRTSFSYSAARRPIPAETDPHQLFAAFFRPDAEASDPAAAAARAARRLRDRRSVLDVVAGDVAVLARRLGRSERDKLDAHATSLRELEGRLGPAPAPLPAARCRRAAAAAPADPRDEAHVETLCERMLDFIATALVCNLTRIVTFQFGVCGNAWRYGWLGMHLDGHEQAHQDTGSPTAAANMVQISRWHATEVARLARALDAIPEGEGTALDHTLLVWANENATGAHGLENVPLVLIGRAGGRLPAGGGVLDHGVFPHHQLGVSILRLMGSDAVGFGDRPTCGPWSGLPA